VQRTFGQRLRRLLDQAERRVNAGDRVVSAVLALLGLAVIATLAAVAWPTLMEPRPEYTAATDPRPAYVNRIREKIQKATEATVATLPTPAGMGSLLVRIEVAPDGTLLSAAVGETSGVPALDDLALSIVRASAPFEAFPLEARGSTKVMEITSEFIFQ
jgi:TonB family protein